VTHARDDAPSVAILLSTFNGAPYLDTQLQSFLTQSHTNWTLHWRDDGSSDDSVDVMTRFSDGAGCGRCVLHPSGERLNAPASFLTLLRQSVASRSAMFAFSDQDDIWLPEKLARGVAALSGIPPDVPGLYCSGHTLVDDCLRPIGHSPVARRPPSFPAAMTQNIAQGCTVMLNRAAAELIANSEPADQTWHDWWSYLVVTASGGRVLVDPAETMLYRQHGANQVGNAGSLLQRGVGVVRRGRRPFMSLVRSHITGLRRQPHLLTEASRAQLAVIETGLNGGFFARLSALRLSGFRRQSWPEDMVFRLWFLLG
jgi:glycosyltransferase involved in cell wall biosynthesis